MRHELRDTLAIAALVAIAAWSLRCGGEAFTEGAAVVDGGGVLLEAGADAGETSDAGPEARPALESMETEARAAPPPDASGLAFDAGELVDAGDVDAGPPAYCCKLSCGVHGTIDAGWTCSPPCDPIVGSGCGYGAVCGLVVVCP